MSDRSIRSIVSRRPVASGHPRGKRGRGAAAGPPRTSRLFGLLVSLAVVSGTALPAGLATPVAATPTAPKPAAAAAAAAAAAGEIKPSVVRIASPKEDTLVGGAPLTAKVWTATGTTDFKATTDEADVTSSFRRLGREWVGLLRGVPAGTNTLVVTVRKGGKVYRARAEVTVKGAQRDLLGVAPVSPARQVTDPGVKSVALRVDPTATTTATLNGTPVRLSRAPGAGAVREAVLSRNDGLRTGSNVFVAQSYRANGEWETLRVPFDVAAGLPLAEAGDTVHVAKGDTITLDGTDSKPGAASGRLSYQWQTVRAPVGVPPMALPPGSKASFRLSTPGDYLIKLTVTERRGSAVLRSTDLLSATAVAKVAPMGQRLATFVPDPAKQSTELGLQLGGTWYPWSKYFSNASAGVFAFDARALTFPMGTDSKPVLPKALSNDNFSSDLKDFLGRLGAGQLLVIVTTDGFAGDFTSRVVAYDGPHGGDPLYVLAGGTLNEGLTISDETGKPEHVGGLAGYLRYSTDDGTSHAGSASPYGTGLYRFVQDDQLTFSTSASRTVTGGIADGVTYQLAVPSGYARANQVVGRTELQQPAVLQPPTSGLGQQWQLSRVYGDYYELVDRAGGCLNLSGTDGRSVLVWPCTGTHQPNELWTPVADTKSDNFRLQSAQRPLVKYQKGETAANILSRADDGTLVVGPISTGNKDQLWTWRVPGGIYTMLGSYSAKAAAEPDDAARPGDQLVSAATTGGLEQQWRVVPRQGDEFGLQNLASGLCMAVGGDGEDGAAIQRAACDSKDVNQDWSMRTNTEGAYLQSGAGLYLAVGGGDKLVQQDFDPSFPAQAQPLWSLSRQPEPVVGGAYAVVDGAGRTLHVSGDGKAVSPDRAEGAQARQDWVVREASTSQPGSGLVQVYNRTSKTCLSLLGEPALASDVGAAPCVGWEDGGGSTWRLEPRDDGGYSLATAVKDRQRNTVLTVAGNGTLLATSPRNDPAAQQWQLAGRPVTMQLGGAEWSSSLPIGSAGFVVLAADAAARPLPGYPRSYWTNGASGNQPDQAAMANDLKQLGSQSGVTVLVQSVGRPWPTTDVWNAMADGIAAVNLPRQPFLELDGSGDFAGAGCGKRCTGSIPWVSESVRREIDPGLVGARVDGTLRRNESAEFEPSGAAGALDSTFAPLVDRPTQPWPLADSKARQDVLADIAERLSGYDKTCGDPSVTGLDPIRNGYCLVNYDQTQNWSNLRADLQNLTYQATTDYTEDDFTTAQSQLSIEFDQLTSVHTLMAGTRSFYRDASAGGVWTRDAATTISDGIKNQLPKTRIDHGPSAGGWIAAAADTFGLLKALKPLVLAAPEGGVGDPPAKPKEGFAAGDAVESALALAGDIVDLVGDNDSETEGIDDEINAYADDYAKELNDQTDTMVHNLLTVENILVTDPVKLEAASGSGHGQWNLTIDDQATVRTANQAGLTRNIWFKLFPTAYEMWSWPTITHPDLKPTDIVCFTAKPLGGSWHHMYTGTDPDAIFQPPSSVTSSGRPGSDTATLVMTPVTMRKVSVDEDRTLSAGLRSALALNTGYGRRDGDTWRIAAKGEFLSAIPLTGVSYPSDLDLTGTGSGDACRLQYPGGGTVGF